MNESVSSPPTESKEQPASAPSRPDVKAANRRLHERIPVNSRVLISCEGKQTAGRRIRARAIDISKSGILLESEEPFASGTVVLLQTASLAFLGKACVRHCAMKGAKFRLGLYVPDRVLRGF